MPLPDERRVLDACVLVPFGLCDLLVRLTEEPRVYQPRWSDQILDEVCRTQIDKLGWPGHLSDSWRKAVRTAFPEALVLGYERHLPKCHGDPKDRHVMAAAIEAEATGIVTFNLRDFPPDALTLCGLTPRHPDAFLSACLAGHPELVRRRVAEIAARRSIAPDDVVARLGHLLPDFTARYQGG